MIGVKLMTGLAADIGPADLILVLGVACHATLLAYIPQPRWKAFFYALPVPFTLAMVAVGQPVNVTHVLGLPVVFLFAHLVRILYNRGISIVLAIVFAGAVYCLISGSVAQVVPVNSASFWGMLGAVFLAGAFLHRTLPQRREPPHRSPMPVYFKFVIIVCVISGLLVLKDFLEGSMAFFPMVGVVAAYESRFSLWSWARQIPILMLGMIGLLGVARLLQHVLPLIPALVCGWGVFLVIVGVMTRRMWAKART